MMTDFGEVRVSRADIARMAGVKRPAVTNWERRHTDFPAPTGGGELDMYRADQVLEWLSGRTIPANALEPGEPTGTTYGDRFRAALGGGPSGGLLSAVEQLAGRYADRSRGRLRAVDYFQLLLFLVFMQSQNKERWSDCVADPDLVRSELRLPKEYATSDLPEVLGLLDRNPPASPDESRQAFDRLLELLRDADARGADEFFTPPSVSRVMARILALHGHAAHRHAAERLHDPFCRSGELLAGYLDAVTGQGGPVPVSVSGRAPQEAVLRLAEMNAILHGADSTSFRLGPVLPAEGEPVDPPESFDTVITNPPFGGRISKSVAPPDFWRYGSKIGRAHV